MPKPVDDPDVTLAELRLLATRILNERSDENTARLFADTFALLDGWLRSGGDLPVDWGERIS